MSAAPFSGLFFLPPFVENLLDPGNDVGLCLAFFLGRIAQSVEQRIENPCVGGSIPPLATTLKPLKFNDLRGFLLAEEKAEAWFGLTPFEAF